MLDSIPECLCLSIGAIVDCSVCSGSTKCSNCGGRGEVLCSVCGGNGWQLVFCSPCGGSGRNNDGSACQRCGMTGRAKEDCPTHQRCQSCNGSGICSFRRDPALQHGQCEGYLFSYSGQKVNVPVVKFGHSSLITDELWSYNPEVKLMEQGYALD
jgi:hypothetical protein